MFHETSGREDEAAVGAAAPLPIDVRVTLVSSGGEEKQEVSFTADRLTPGAALSHMLQAAVAEAEVSRAAQQLKTAKRKLSAARKASAGGAAAPLA